MLYLKPVDHRLSYCKQSIWNHRFFFNKSSYLTLAELTATFLRSTLRRIRDVTLKDRWSDCTNATPVDRLIWRQHRRMKNAGRQLTCIQTRNIHIGPEKGPDLRERRQTPFRIGRKKDAAAGCGPAHDGRTMIMFPSQFSRFSAGWLSEWRFFTREPRIYAIRTRRVCRVSALSSA